MYNTINATTTIINTPENLSEDYLFIVARVCEGSVWYYGSYKSQLRAHEVAKEVDGFVLWIK